jgi:hypothetical protein
MLWPLTTGVPLWTFNSHRQAFGEFDLCICIMELRFGSVLRKNAETFWKKVTQEIISRVNIVPIAEREALSAGDILAELRKKSENIGLEDVLIAASTLTGRKSFIKPKVTNTAYRLILILFGGGEDAKIVYI